MPCHLVYMSDPSPNDFGSVFKQILAFLQEVFDALIAAGEQREWSKALLIVLAAVFPVLMLLKLLGIEIPSMFLWIYGSAVIFLFLAAFILGLLKNFDSWHMDRVAKRCLIFFLLLLLGLFSFLLLNDRFIASDYSPLDFSKYEYDEQDFFSIGENVLIDLKSPVFNSPSWSDCREQAAYSSKENGSRRFENSNFGDAENQLSDFVARCPNDPEARIYLNNSRVMESQSSFFEIVVSVPISREEGKGGNDSQEILRGVELAQFDINEEDLLGENIKFLVGIMDDGPISNPDGSGHNNDENEVAKKAAEFIADNTRRLGVIGHFTSNATEAASEIYDRHNLTLISPTSTAIRCTDNCDAIDTDSYTGRSEVVLNEKVFRTPPDDNKSAQALANYFAKTGGDVAIVYQSDSVYSNSFKVAFENAYASVGKGEVVNDSQNDKCNIWTNSKSQDLIMEDIDECLDFASRKNVKALLLVPTSKDAPNLFGDTGILRKAKARDFVILGADSMYDEEVFKEADDIAVSVPWHRSQKYNDINEDNNIEIDDIEHSFEKKAAKHYYYKVGNQKKYALVNWRTAMAYDAAHALAAGIVASSKQSHIMELIKFLNKDLYFNCIKANLPLKIAKDDFRSYSSLDTISQASDLPKADNLRFTNGDRKVTSSLAVIVRRCEVNSIRALRKDEECENT